MATIKYRITAVAGQNYGWTTVTVNGRTMGYVRKVEGKWYAKSAGGKQRRVGFHTRQRATAWLMTGTTWVAAGTR